MLLQVELNAYKSFMILPVQLNVDHIYVTRETLEFLLQFVRELRYREPPVIQFFFLCSWYRASFKSCK